MIRVLCAKTGNALANFIHAITLHIMPGQLQQSGDMLNLFADHMESTYGRPVDVTSFEAGPHYRHIIGISYDDMEQYDAVQAALETDEFYAQWSQDVLGVIDAETIEKNIGRYL